MALLDLMRRLPRTERNLAARHGAQTPENVALARRFGREYFDGSRDTGYGGYTYDGRWIPVADDIVRHFPLGPGPRILDVGWEPRIDLDTGLREMVEWGRKYLDVLKDWDTGYTLRA